MARRSEWTWAAALFAAAFALYWGTALLAGSTHSPDVAYFDHLAAAFLEGRLYLPHPPAVHDLTPYQGRWYVPFPPLPALLLLPWVAWRGVAGTSTVLFSSLMGAANVALVYLLLTGLSARGWSRLGLRDNLWLTVLFGLGSVHWYMAPIGSVWFVAQICTVTFVALAVWLAVTTNSPWAAGTALAMAMLARPNVAFTWVLLVGIAAQQLGEGWRTRPGVGRLVGWGVAAGLPMAIAVGGLLGYNLARFGSPWDFGYATENVAERLAPDLHTYGQFNLRYLGRNFWAMWLALPEWSWRHNLPLPNPEGMSLLLTTPALVYLARARSRTPLVLGAWGAFLLLMVPLLLYYNTGWYQFGYRFSLDFMVPVMVLLAVAAGERVSPWMRGLILAGVLVNLAGVLWWFFR
ncbi:hypothetical protein FKZ61_009700 [Litorilinea aerophila]|uniref:Glycosyltransferase RgtA/B/C/D-like domain-containing protein n=1 Tax=Litorilinea aerophila TaxID=1204385 RepID=A0A540VGU8_9CHLR|nr:hypothetical protein [Litorilinea aerophila]MCC9076381.1 hypothetical protein [Litorilinea aerophila]